jgi:tRNA-modifying protein YgfZ
MIDAAARDRVVVEGPDAQTYLQGQIAQDIRDLAVGDERWTLVLDPTGKIEALAAVARTDTERFVFDTDAGYGERLAARLSRFKIRVQAEITVEPAARREPSEPYETARIEAGWPRMGHEIVPGETIPAATGVETVAVSFTKGCYPGQELVERMNSRGSEAPRTLRVVSADGGAVDELTYVVGGPIVDADGVEVGTITSVAADGRTAVGYVKRGATAGRAPAHAATEN